MRCSGTPSRTSKLAGTRSPSTSPRALLCGGYYGPSAPTRDTYLWDEKTLTGTMESAIAEGACGPAGTDTYPFALIRM